MSSVQVVIVQDQQTHENDVRRSKEESKAAAHLYEQFMEMPMMMVTSNLKNKKKSVFDMSGDQA